MVKPSANFRTQQFKLGTEEILYVNMSFHKLQRKTLIALGNLGYVLRVESSPWEQRQSCIIQLHMWASSINISTSNASINLMAWHPPPPQAGRWMSERVYQSNWPEDKNTCIPLERLDTFSWIPHHIQPKLGIVMVGNSRNSQP